MPTAVLIVWARSPAAVSGVASPRGVSWAGPLAGRLVIL